MMDDNENLAYIPSNSVFAAKINTSLLLKLTASEVISTKDQELLDQMEDLDLQSGKNPFNGINFASNIYFFILPHEKTFIEGMLFNLSDKAAFQEYYSSVGNYPAYANDGVGVILLSDPNSLNSIETDKLNKLAQDIITNKSNEKQDIDFSGEESVISTWSTDPSEKIPFSNMLDLTFEPNKIRLAGTMSITEDIPNETSYLERRGISVASSLIPKELNDSLQVFLNKIGSEDQFRIRSFSANYRGVNFDQAEKLSINPQLELLINADTALNWTHLSQLLETGGYIKRLDSTQFMFSEISFSVSQPDEDQIIFYNGSNPSDQEVRNELFEFSGDPSLLFKVGGNSPYGQFLNFIPLFRSGKALTEATSNTNIQIIPKGNNQYEVKGFLEFKPGYSPIVELIKFLNSSALLK